MKQTKKNNINELQYSPKIQRLQYSKYFKKNILNLVQKQKQCKSIQQFLPFDPTIINILDDPTQLQNNNVYNDQYAVIHCSKYRFGDRYFGSKQISMEQQIKYMLNIMGVQGQKDERRQGYLQWFVKIDKNNKQIVQNIEQNSKIVLYKIFKIVCIQNQLTIAQVNNSYKSQTINIQNPILLNTKNNNTIIKCIYHSNINTILQQNSHQQIIVIISQNIHNNCQYKVYKFNKYSHTNNIKQKCQFNIQVRLYNNIEYVLLMLQLFKQQISLFYQQLQHIFTYQLYYKHNGKRQLEFGVRISCQQTTNKQYKNIHKRHKKQENILKLLKILKYYNQQLSISLGSIQYKYIQIYKHSNSNNSTSTYKTIVQQQQSTQNQPCIANNVYLFIDFNSVIRTRRSIDKNMGKQQYAYDIVTLLANVLDSGYNNQAYVKDIKDIVNTADQNIIISKFNTFIHNIDNLLNQQ